MIAFFAVFTKYIDSSPQNERLPRFAELPYLLKARVELIKLNPGWLYDNTYLWAASSAT